MPDSSLFGLCCFWASEVFVEQSAFVPVFEPRQRSLLVMSLARFPRVFCSVGVVALLGLLAVPARAATTTYDTNNTPYTGGTIDPGDTVLLNDGATVAGDITNNGTLQFNQSTGNTLTISNSISGTGTLSLTNSGTLNLAGTSGAANTVVLDMTTSASAGLLQIHSGTGDLQVGGSGTGTLNVVGGRVSNLAGFLGTIAGSVGTATVSSGAWANSGDLYVGYTGTGTLNVNGGSVSNTVGYIGYDNGSVGIATVSSGTWATSGDLWVGYSYNDVPSQDFQNGTGTLTMTGGLVTVSGVLQRGILGTINLNAGGTLQVGTGGAGSRLGVDNLTNNGTLAFNHSDNYRYSGTISGSGAVTKAGAGTLRLTGSSSYTGGTTISAGTLQIGAGGTTGSIAGSVVNNAALTFNRSDALTYSGTISGTGAVTKLGGGTLTLAGANTYSGLTTISGGTLALSGTGSIGNGGLNLGTTGSPGVFDLSALTAGAYSLPASGNLAGVGTLSGNGKSLAVLGSLAPGNSAGTITVGTGLSLDLSLSGSSVFEITSPAYTAGTYDLVSGSGSVVFGGILNLAFSGGSYADGTDVLQIFANTGGRSGNFSAVNATGLGAGQSATFNAVTGFITVVPEPSTVASLLAGLACGGYSMFRRHRAH
jgi:autotransporter-associated beta strand protein/T5SS/PEP-CTERM-associated repeat protein